MGKQLGEFRAAVRSLLNEPYPALFTDDEIDGWINDGQRDIAIKAKCVEDTQTLTITTGTKAYEFDGFTCLSILYNDVALMKITPKQLGHIEENGSTPQFWYEWDNYAYIHPTPVADTTLTALVAGDTDDMDADNAESILPLQFQDLIILYATYRGLIKKGQFAQAQQVYSIYIKELSFHQTNDSVGYAQPEDFSEYKIPNQYMQVSQGKAR